MRKTLVRSLVFCALIAVCLCCQAVRVAHAQAHADQGIKELQGQWRVVENHVADETRHEERSNESSSVWNNLNLERARNEDRWQDARGQRVDRKAALSTSA